MALPPAERARLGEDRADFEHHRLAPEHREVLGRAEARCRRAVLAAVGPSPAGGEVEVPAACGEGSLRQRLDDPEGWSDVRVRPEMTDVVVLHTGGLPQSCVLDSILEARARVDEPVNRVLSEMGLRPAGTSWRVSGHLWYPGGSVMGWHTNVRVPGWRAYVTWVGQPGRSFFRYRAADGMLVTSRDTGLDLRLFHLDADQALWHCVWAGTDRHSFGYRLVEDPGA
jgi:hypothetical protein